MRAPKGKGAAPKRSPSAEFWRAAHRARRERRITAGALQFLHTLARLARTRGDGVAVTLGERVLSRITGEHRSTIQRHKAALAEAGLIQRLKTWAKTDPRRQKWFWEETIVLSTPCETPRGPILGPRSADSKQVRGRGPILGPPLYRDESPSGKDETESPAAEPPAVAAAATPPEKEKKASRGERQQRASKPKPTPQSPDVKEELIPPEELAKRWRKVMEAHHAPRRAD